MFRSSSFDELNKFLVRIIKLLFIFGSKGQEVIYITDNDKVYAFGENKYGRLGLGHQIPVKEPTIVIELCNKGIIDIANGEKHVIARTSDGKIYRWGYNWSKGFNCETPDIDQCKPSLVHFSRDEFVIDMSCGDIHSLVLTKSGKIYSWGCNKWGQLGNGEEISQLLPVEPFEVKRTDREKIISISSGMRHSLALTESGRVLSWGDNQWGQLGIGVTGNSCRLPEYIIFKEMEGKEVKIEKICCGSRHSLFLTSDGHVYACGGNYYGQVGSHNAKVHCIPTKLYIPEKIIDIASNSFCDISIALSSNVNLFIWGQCGWQIITKPKLSLFTSINNIFRNYQGITNGVIRLTKKRRRIRENYENQTQEKKLKFSPPHDLFGNIVLMKNRRFNDLFDNGKMVREFKELEKIGSGYWGVVLKAKNFDGKVYAIKCIPLNSYEESIFKELEIMRELSGKYVVQTNDSWLEENYIGKGDFDNSENMSIDKNHVIYLPEKSLLLHIQMEYCPKTLRETINQINFELNQKPYEIMTPTGYFISSELFKEVVECVDFLHCQKPPIIHRDLKPRNILITSGTNGRFVKLADFGLATFHECDDQSHSAEKGTNKYMAPEVQSTRNYNTKVDIYSIGVIIQELFNIDLNEYEEILKKISAGCDSILKQKYSGVFKLMRAMRELQHRKRPNCDHILKIENSWALNCFEFQKLVENFDQSGIQDIFHISFIRQKLERSKNIPQQRPADEDISFDSSDYSKDNEYVNEFEELLNIGIGNFAVVAKARNKFNNEFYAIKKVPLIENQIKPILTELRAITGLRSDYVVQYESFWVEENYVLMENYKDENLLNSTIKSNHVIFDVFKPYLLHIQMEHCFCSLKDLIETINQEMNQKHRGKLVLISYFIAKELFIELLEIMSYLHQQNPPVIHGDLKPNNFLITHGFNGRFVKLVDIGTATVQAHHDRISRYHANKTMKYLAPDFVDEKFKTIDQKTDIYSLGVIIQELFNFNIKKPLSEKNNQLFINNYKKIFEFAKKMVSDEKILRPNCIDILKEVDSWRLCICILKSDEKFEEILNSVDFEKTINDGLIPYIIQKKLKHDNYFSQKCSCVHQVTAIPYGGQ